MEITKKEVVWEIERDDGEKFQLFDIVDGGMIVDLVEDDGVWRACFFDGIECWVEDVAEL